ncbi:hypothetical protein D1614_16265 [Maribellus luteus]|uniref:Uncharacterized protein n=1 Tax=Maribellus luteus TaxID=2305463 RepID=A0A399SUF9_9BACT|nr:hypothetical protein D1614_16265 [Maribellus luteus]
MGNLFSKHRKCTIANLRRCLPASVKAISHFSKQREPPESMIYITSRQFFQNEKIAGEMDIFVF